MNATRERLPGKSTVGLFMGGQDHVSFFECLSIRQNVQSRRNGFISIETMINLLIQVRF